MVCMSIIAYSKNLHAKDITYPVHPVLYVAITLILSILYGLTLAPFIRMSL